MSAAHVPSAQLDATQMITRWPLCAATPPEIGANSSVMKLTAPSVMYAQTELS